MKNGIPQTHTLRKYLSDFVNQNDKSDTPTPYDLIELFKAGKIKV